MNDSYLFLAKPTYAFRTLPFLAQSVVLAFIISEELFVVNVYNYIYINLFSIHYSQFY